MGEFPSHGQNYLKERVHDVELCASCGACVNVCPYLATYRDRTVILDECDKEEGRCFTVCPRAPTDLELLRKKLFDPAIITPEIGAVRGFYVTRASDPNIRNVAQHGGTVTALMKLALKEQMIDTAILVEGDDAFSGEAVAVTHPDKVNKTGRSKFTAVPIVETFNRTVQGPAEKVGLVATPCQALSLAKMKVNPPAEKANETNIRKLQLTIGLFCGWAFSWKALDSFLRHKLGSKTIVSLDIPPSRYHSLEVVTAEETLQISLDELLPMIRPSCRYCFDMTAEFTDISVGSARLPEGWAISKTWNQVVVRSQFGEQLVKLAEQKGVLEFREVPDGSLEKLKAAAMSKKRNAVKNLIDKSGNPHDLYYLKCDDPVFSGLIP